MGLAQFIKTSAIMATSIVVFTALFGLAVGQFGPHPFARPGFGRFGNPNLHNSFHRYPNTGNNAASGQNGGMFGGGNSVGGGRGVGGMGAGGMGGGMGMGANMFGNGPMPRGGVCPMLQGVSDMQAFKTSCMTLMQTSPQDVECTPGPWGKQCPGGTKCCPQAVDGQCQLKCSAPIESLMRVGSCPTGFYDKPAPGMGWIGGMCFYAKSIGKRQGQAWDPECRFDGDCPGSQKCCSPEINPDNLFATCVRKCTDIN